MSKNLTSEVTGIQFELDDKIKKYIDKKISRLVDYIPRHARPTAFANTKITKVDQKDNNKYECEIILTLPDRTLVARDLAPNAYAAVDIAEVKLKSQIRRYKTERRVDGVRTGGFVAQLKRSLRRRK